MREICADVITQTVKRLCIEANCYLPGDMKACIENSRKEEKWPQAQEILDRIIENYTIADEKAQPICQDTGVACVFLKIGQDVHIEGDITEAVNEGVRQGYAEGYLRKSVVRDPLDRVNTGDNTPAMLYTELVPGEQIEINGPRDAQAKGISIVHQELNLMQDLTVAENIFIGREPNKGLVLDKAEQRIIKLKETTTEEEQPNTDPIVGSESDVGVVIAIVIIAVLMAGIVAVVVAYEIRKKKAKATAAAETDAAEVTDEQ